jgi:hypothetical protein
LRVARALLIFGDDVKGVIHQRDVGQVQGSVY